MIQNAIQPPSCRLAWPGRLPDCDRAMLIAITERVEPF